MILLKRVSRHKSSSNKSSDNSLHNNNNIKQSFTTVDAINAMYYFSRNIVNQSECYGNWW